MSEDPAKAGDSIERPAQIRAHRMLANGDAEVGEKVVRGLERCPSEREVAPRVPDLVAELVVQPPGMPVHRVVFRAVGFRAVDEPDLGAIADSVSGTNHPPSECGSL